MLPALDYDDSRHQNQKAAKEHPQGHTHGTAARLVPWIQNTVDEQAKGITMKFVAVSLAIAATSAIAAPVAVQRDLVQQPSGKSGPGSLSGTLDLGPIEIAGEVGPKGADGHVAIGDLLVLSGGAGPKGASGVIYGDLLGDKSIGGHAGATGGKGHILRDLVKQPSGKSGPGSSSGTLDLGPIEIAGEVGPKGADGHIAIGDLLVLSGGAGPKGVSGVIYGDLLGDKSIGGHAGATGGKGHIL
ncbi:hypothetical protein OC834_000030 [Tilletia horrida]|nr:hypothetical protein OC834_000030 [Tilletia horrida]